MAELLDAAAVTDALGGLPGWTRDGDSLVRTAKLPSFPAATMLSLTMGLPHAHTLHPPSGPPPVPPTPLPPVGPIMLGTIAYRTDELRKPKRKGCGLVDNAARCPQGPQPQQQQPPGT